MIKIGDYMLFKEHNPPCDSCGKTTTKKIYGYQDWLDSIAKSKTQGVQK